jgi:hypothetical protein
LVWLLLVAWLAAPAPQLPAAAVTTLLQLLHLHCLLLLLLLLCHQQRE